MLILGIDTSCDDTSASLVEFGPPGGGGPAIISSVVSSQEALHRAYGGIVPELASRRHIEMIGPVVLEALGGRPPGGLDGVAVCHGPGLIGSLLVGCSFGKAMGYAHGVPLIGVNHLEGHALTAFLPGVEAVGGPWPPEFPLIALVISGGHTSLYLVRGFGDYEELGRTRDDAAGEAYDKVAKLMGLGYPGGPAMDRLAGQGDPKAVRFPRAYMPGTLDFSFSGLKTAVRLALEGPGDARPEDVAASFQASVADVIVRKVKEALGARDGVRGVSLSGGVAANAGLRGRMARAMQKAGVPLYLPPSRLCTDNAAMIAYAGYHALMRGERSGLGLNPRASLPLGGGGPVPL